MISDFRDCRKGHTAVIIGNGPSLSKVPRAFLDRHLTFGQNKIYLPPFDDFTPSYYVTSDPDKDIDYKQVMSMNCPKFLKSGLLYPNEMDDSVHTFLLTSQHIFSKRPDLVLYEGYSVTFISLQLAYYMGFTTVLLVGVDHRYVEYNPALEDDPNHYTPEYKGKTDFNPIAIAKGQRFIMESMVLAKQAFDMDGRKIINLTEGSNLKVFEFGDVNDW